MGHQHSATILEISAGCGEFSRIIVLNRTIPGFSSRWILPRAWNAPVAYTFAVKMRQMIPRSLSYLICMLISISCLSQDITGNVVKIHDGDSFLLETADSIYRVRLSGIDCPEINQPYGAEARDFTESYISDSVTITPLTVDRYGRTIADVFVGGRLINLILVEHGYAWHYKRYSSDSTLAAAEEQARAKQRGLWSDEYIVAPWDWRSGNYDWRKFIADDVGKVFACIGSENMHFHHSNYCSDLESCTSTIILLYPTEAMQVYNKRQCTSCYHEE